MSTEKLPEWALIKADELYRAIWDGIIEYKPPSLARHQIARALVETRDAALEEAATYAANWVLPDGDHCTELAIEIRALKSQAPVGSEK